MHGPIRLPFQPRPPTGLFARFQRKFENFWEEFQILREIVRVLREHPEYRGVLSDKAILEEVARGNLVISPFMEDHLGTSSHDVTLGEFYYKEQDPTHNARIYNIFDKEEVGRIWGVPCQAEPIAKLLPNASDRKNIPEDARAILLRPGETILGHTNEFIGGRNIITTMMKARSSLGRCFIEVCKCAGWGDVGYTNRWTMEITNNSRYYTIPLVVGMRLAQIVFFYTGAIREKDYTEGKFTKYQTSKSLEDLKRDWSPEAMLPKLYNDFKKS